MQLNLLKTNFGTRYLRLEIRELYLKIYYELNYTESLLSAVDSFRHYLKGTEFSIQNITGAKNFLNCLTRLLNISERKEKAEIYSIKKEMSGENNLHHKLWLIEKVNALENL